MKRDACPSVMPLVLGVQRFSAQSGVGEENELQRSVAASLEWMSGVVGASSSGSARRLSEGANDWEAWQMLTQMLLSLLVLELQRAQPLRVLLFEPMSLLLAPLLVLVLEARDLRLHTGAPPFEGALLPAEPLLVLLLAQLQLILPLL